MQAKSEKIAALRADYKIQKQEINWKTYSEYVDIDTGEKLTQEQVVTNYIIIKKQKHVKVIKTSGTITITNECRITSQLRLF